MVSLRVRAMQMLYSYTTDSSIICDHPVQMKSSLDDQMSEAIFILNQYHHHIQRKQLQFPTMMSNETIFNFFQNYFISLYNSRNLSQCDKRVKSIFLKSRDSHTTHFVLTIFQMVFLKKFCPFYLAFLVSAAELLRISFYCPLQFQSLY